MPRYLWDGGQLQGALSFMEAETASRCPEPPVGGDSFNVPIGLWGRGQLQSDESFLRLEQL